MSDENYINAISHLTGTSVSAKRYRYTGKEWDDETGLYYYGARYYASWLGRWTGCDPSVEDGLNLYVFCQNNPINKVDSDGRWSIDWGEVGRGAAYTALAVEAPKVEAPKSRGYDRPEIEKKSGKAVKEKDVVDDWNDFLSENHSNIDPRDCKVDPDRIWSSDGKRSVRYGEHEMKSPVNKHHYRKETWYGDRVENDLQRI